MGNNDERWKDPAAWSCLDDSQREIINEWYKRILQTEKKEKENALRISKTAAWTIVIPLSVWYAMSQPSFGESVLWFLINLFAALAVFTIIALVSYQVSEFACREGFSKTRLAIYWVIYAIVVFLLLLKVYV